jgi:hypothetical protein
MGKPYSQDLRESVITAVDTGTGATQSPVTKGRRQNHRWPSSQQSLTLSPKSACTSAQTASQTKAIAVNYESALVPRLSR